MFLAFFDPAWRSHPFLTSPLPHFSARARDINKKCWRLLRAIPSAQYPLPPGSSGAGQESAWNALPAPDLCPGGWGGRCHRQHVYAFWTGGRRKRDPGIEPRSLGPEAERPNPYPKPRLITSYLGLRRAPSGGASRSGPAPSGDGGGGVRCHLGRAVFRPLPRPQAGSPPSAA